MDTLFSTTTVLLSSEYVESVSMENLMGKLRKVRRETGINFKKVRKTFALVGSYRMVEEAFELLQQWLKKPYLEPQGDGTIGEFEQIERVQNEVSWQGANFSPNLVSLKEHVINVDRIKQELEDGYLSVSGECSEIENMSLTSNEGTYGSSEETFDQDHVIKQEGHAENSDNSKCDTGSPLKTRASRLKAVKLVKNIIRQEQANTVMPRKARSMTRRLVQSKKVHLKTSKLKKAKSGQDQEVKCSKCDVVLRSRKRLNEHLKRIHLKQFKCIICEKQFGYPTDLHRHKCSGKRKYEQDGSVKQQTKKAQVPELLPCKECTYMATSKKRYNEHMKRKHKLTHKCDACDKCFGFSKDLSRHKENVHAEPSHFCDKCSSFYKSKAVYEHHMKTHEEGYVKPSFSCQICHRSFTTKYVLSLHIKSEHLGIKKTWLCSHCGKKFRQLNSYKMHMNVHQGIKPYVCDLCGKSFAYDKSLKEHKHMHDTVRKFQCRICLKTYRQRTTLQIHMKIHKTTKDFVCKTCGRGFNQKQSLERHERIHTGIKPYTCILCQRKFGDSSTIRRHMLGIHKKSSDNWRDDIVTAARPKSDHYIEGGPGYNTCYTKKGSAFISKYHTKNSETYQRLSQTSVDDGLESHATIEQGSQPCQRELSPQTNIDREAEFTAEPYYESNTSLQRQQSALKLSEQHQLSGDPYAANTQFSSLSSVSHIQPDPDSRNLGIGHTNNPSSLAYDIPSNFSATVHQHSGNTHQDDLMVNTIFQQRQLTSNAIYLPVLTPMTGGTDVGISESQQTRTHNSDSSGDATLSQPMSNIWGYPTYISPANFASFLGHQP